MRFDELHVNPWRARFKGRSFPCSIGRGGIGAKQREGDGITPKGEFKALSMMCRTDRLNLHRCDAIPADAVWSDDPEDAYYNTLQRGFPYPHSHERLRRPDPLYDIVVDLDFNRTDPRPGKGSAIFMHIWRKPRHPTEGCLAFSKSDLIWIVENWTPNSRVVTSS